MSIPLHYIIQREDFVYTKKNGEAESEKEKVKRNNKKRRTTPKVNYICMVEVRC